MGDLGKYIVAKGVKKLPKVQKIAQSGHTDSKVRYCPVNHYTVFQQDCLVALMGASGKGASANHAVFLQKKLGHSRPHFLIVVFSIQLTVNVQNKILPMTYLEPRTSGIGSNHSTNWATIIAQNHAVG